MEFIDSHSHPCFSYDQFALLAKENVIRFDMEGFLAEADRCGIKKSVAIGVDAKSDELVKRLAEKSDRIIPILGIEKRELAFYLKLAKAGLRDKSFSGIKVFLGYDDYFPTSRLLEPFYRLAEKHEVPIMFHSGDMWVGIVEHRKKTREASPRVKYAHPLAIDDVASEHPGMKIVVSHAGNPWIEDVAEIIYRNDNCYADISGWFIGKVDDPSGYSTLMKDRLNFLLSFAGPEKLMFGTDWPLIRMDMYTKFLTDALGGHALELVAHKNAEKFWGVKI